jgi:hypothetical protein
LGLPPNPVVPPAWVNWSMLPSNLQGELSWSRPAARVGGPQRGRLAAGLRQVHRRAGRHTVVREQISRALGLGGGVR